MHARNFYHRITSV